MLMLVIMLVRVLDSRFTFCHPACRVVACAEAGAKQFTRRGGKDL